MATPVRKEHRDVVGVRFQAGEHMCGIFAGRAAQIRIEGPAMPDPGKCPCPFVTTATWAGMFLIATWAGFTEPCPASMAFV